MTAALEDLQHCPDWPRWLSQEQAARYVGVSVNQFLAEVAEGKWPKPKPRGRRLTYDRKLLDLASDRESGIGQEISGPAGLDPEAVALACIGAAA